MQPMQQPAIETQPYVSVASPIQPPIVQAMQPIQDNTISPFGRSPIIVPQNIEKKLKGRYTMDDLIQHVMAAVDSHDRKTI